MNPPCPAVRLVEVGPRDGLQNEPAPVATADKLALIARLAAAGLREIEVGAFVSPKWVPQMADSAAVCAGLARGGPVRHSVLVPNGPGWEAARAAGGIDEIAVFAAATEGFSRRNTNASIAEVLRRLEPVVEAARREGYSVRGYVSCVVGCPVDGAVAPEAVAAVAAALDGLGCREVSLGDTLGVGRPAEVARMLEAVLRRVPADRLAGHFHDTWGLAAANVLQSLALGLRTFDGAVAGLGGCPYAAGARGNVATEDLVYLLEGQGLATGVDLDALVDTAAWISARLGRPLGSRVGQARQAQRARAAAAAPPPAA